jgi:hypothetical protein
LPIKTPLSKIKEENHEHQSDVTNEHIYAVGIIKGVLKIKIKASWIWWFLGKAEAIRRISKEAWGQQRRISVK